MADKIDELSALGDAELGKMLGFDDKVKTFKADLAKASKLSGDARARVLKTLTNMFSPQSYAVDDFAYSIQSAERKEKTGSCPAEIVACACGDD